MAVPPKFRNLLRPALEAILFTLLGVAFFSKDMEVTILHGSYVVLSAERGFALWLFYRVIRSGRLLSPANELVKEMALFGVWGAAILSVLGSSAFESGYRQLLSQKFYNPEVSEAAGRAVETVMPAWRIEALIHSTQYQIVLVGIALGLASWVIYRVTRWFITAKPLTRLLERWSIGEKIFMG